MQSSVKQYIFWMRKKTKRKFCQKQNHSIVEISNDYHSDLNIDSLPDEIFVKIFSYLTQNELCQIGRVSRRWYILSRCPVLWKEVDVKIRQHYTYKDKAPSRVIKMLPPCVTRIKLHILYPQISEVGLDFNKFSVRLQTRCPNLHTLILCHVTLSNSLQAVLYSCIQLLENLQVLVLHYSKFGSNSWTQCFLHNPVQENDVIASKIKVLDLCGSNINSFNELEFSKMPHLKKLHLADTDICDPCFKNDAVFLNQLELLDLRCTLAGWVTFQTIRNNSLHLTELYMCDTDVKDEALIFEDSENIFPHLQIICLRRCHEVTYEGVAFLVNSCQSLKEVYVDSLVIDTFLTLEAFVAPDKFNLGLLKVFDCSRHRCAV